jgi:hypothetical protein
MHGPESEQVAHYFLPVASRADSSIAIGIGAGTDYRGIAHAAG